MKNLAVARRYARALLLIGKEDGRTDSYRKELSGFADLMANENTLNQAITNPLYETSVRRNVLQAVIDKLDISKIMKSFLLLLFDKGRIGYIDSINEFYQKLADELRGIARASLVSATALSDDTVEKIRTALSKKTHKDIVLEVEQDPELIGGIVTKIGDLIWDGSIKTQLSNMRETLKRGEGA
jgi:F-type H+-transporting ATPase subunit delta